MGISLALYVPLAPKQGSEKPPFQIPVKRLETGQKLSIESA